MREDGLTREKRAEEAGGSAAAPGARKKKRKRARHAVRRHPKVGAAVLHEGARLQEGAGVQQRRDALAGGELAARVLRRHARGAAACHRRRAHRLDASQARVDAVRRVQRQRRRLG